MQNWQQFLHKSLENLHPRDNQPSIEDDLQSPGTYSQGTSPTGVLHRSGVRDSQQRISALHLSSEASTHYVQPLRHPGILI